MYKPINAETMIHNVSVEIPVDELNPSYWVGQVVKTIEIIGKTDYLV